MTRDRNIRSLSSLFHPQTSLYTTNVAGQALHPYMHRPTMRPHESLPYLIPSAAQ